MGSYFPHETVRDGQRELISDMNVAFENGKILVAHAPTGLGKTASALSVALEHARQHKKRVFFLTNRHTQHQIAVNTLKLLKEKKGVTISCVDLIGKKWMCNQEVSGLFGSDFNEFCKAIVEKGECEFYNNVRTKKGVSVPAQALVGELVREGALHTEELMARASRDRMCSYEVAMEYAKKADVFIGDYYYLFNPFIQANLFKKIGIELEDVIVIVDEGHNLPNRIADMMSSNLTSNMVKNAILEAKKFHYDGMIYWLQEIQRVLQGLAELKMGEEKLVTREQFEKRVRVVVDYEELINELSLAADEIRKKQRRSYLGGIAEFLESWMGDDDGYVRYVSLRNTHQGESLVLTYSCLDPGLITKSVFDQVHAGVIMSGTLVPTFMYKDVLAITGMEREYPSPFPAENRLSLVVPETSTKYTLRSEAMYQKIAEHCSKMVAGIPGNVALFFPSYDLRDKVCYFLETSKEKFWEKSSMSKEEKDVFIGDFKKAASRGAVLLGVTGANFAEGVDLPGDLLNGVVIIGLPLGRPDLKTREIIKYYENKFGRGWDYGYTYPAMSKCIQSAGRCIRSETDKGAVIFLDERFSWSNYFKSLPREGLRVSREYEKMLEAFFEG